MNIVKTCKKHGDLLESQVRRRTDKKEIVCRQCDSERHKQFRELNPEKAKERRLRYRYLERSPETTELQCSRCKHTKSMDEFNEHMRVIRYPYCKDCRINATRTYKQKESSKEKHREYYKTRYEQIAENNRLQKLYGITLNDYFEILEMQNHVCAICGKQETQKTTSKRVSRLSVDHHHGSGSIRGLLCYACNTGLGQFKEDKSILKRAIAYLEFYENASI